MRTVSPSWIPAASRSFRIPVFFQEVLEEQEAFLGIQVCVTQHFLDLGAFHHKGVLIQLFHSVGKIVIAVVVAGKYSCSKTTGSWGSSFKNLPDVREKLFYTFAADCGDGKYFDALGLKLSADLFYGILVLGIDHVCLVGSDDLRTGSQLLVVIFQFLVNFINIINGVAAFCRSGIYHMKKDLGTLDMTKELVAESDALRSALNESGDISHDKAASVTQIYDTLHGIQVVK